MNDINGERLLNRFLRYVRIDTTADETADVYPSSSGQLELGRLLVRELREAGVSDAVQGKYGVVTATIPATVEGPAATVALSAHLDTSPETSGAHVKPRVVRNYQGGDLMLDQRSAIAIRVADNPELEQLKGATLVTTDGATLLGGDDKAGVAVIVETAVHLLEHPQLVHGPVRIVFTCDEEIGRGVDHLDLGQVDAAVCYTLDGQGAGEIDAETFSADLATVTVRGVNIHPSIAKNRMVNAVKAAAQFVARLPTAERSPETTEGREGFLHPYYVGGGVAEATIKILLRDFRTAALKDYADLLRRIAAEVEAEMTGASVHVETTPQYRNMADGLARDRRAVELAREAHRRLGRTEKITSIRGGTDGARLTERGLPTPNLSTGQHNPHSVLEWVCLDQMVQAAQLLIELLAVWAERQEDSVAGI